ncbi:MAG: thiamine pyrophosphate-dependent dehydrogenase E1 component subunit alpha [Candidatus Omnitrophica bacterium]|nr:thiamine pyrophosphate-dependent dehydrogenase E1 component subunit alpha [Candidatus Omnitrophota bacterium]
MLRIRRLEERIKELYPQQRMRCPCHLTIGQEAIAAGVCAHLGKGDKVFGTYRGHGIYLAKGGGLNALMAELYGKDTGCTSGRGGSMQLIAPEVGFVCTSAIVGGTLPMAVGAALSARLHQAREIALVFFGDGATEEGVFHESMNFAALKKLPVVFVCENNFYSCYTHQRFRQPLDNIYKRAGVYGMPGDCVDGNNVVEVWQAAREAVERARGGGGPSLLECRTYRWLEHVGPHDDTHLGYRSEEEVRQGREECPIKRLQRELQAENLMTPEKVARWEEGIGRELDLAVAFAEQSPFPDARDLARGVYAGE